MLPSAAFSTFKLTSSPPSGVQTSTANVVIVDKSNCSSSTKNVPAQVSEPAVLILCATVALVFTPEHLD